MTRARVLLADDHAPSIRRWLGLLQPEFDVIASVGDGEALIVAAERLGPDVIVTDVVMPRVSGMVAAHQILERQPGARIVFATVHADQSLLRRSLAMGALGYVLKARASEDLPRAVRAALRGQLLISPFPPVDSSFEE